MYSVFFSQLQACRELIVLAVLLSSGIHSVVGRIDAATGLRSGRVPPVLGDGAGEQRRERTDDKLLQELQSVHLTTLLDSRWLESARGASSPH